MADKATVTVEEYTAVGVQLGDINDWADKLRPVLIEKGIPEEKLSGEYECLMDVKKNGDVELIFGEKIKPIEEPAGPVSHSVH